MNELKIHNLEIKPVFRDLIPPLHPDELKTLEESLLQEGCREAIITWNGVIIDGHNRYSLCHKHCIPFKVIEMNFELHEEAVSWICNNQLGRRSLSPETRKYLIGKRYAAEKVIGATNKYGYNQHTKPEEKEVGYKNSNQPNRYKTATKLGNEYNLSQGTVCRYGSYSQEIDRINSSNSTIADSILSGKLKLTHTQIKLISKLSQKELAIISDLIIENLHNTKYLTFSDVQNELKSKKMKLYEPEPAPKPVFLEPTDIAIKKLPEYDPDAEITSLTLTIPSWIGSINRALNNSDLTKVSRPAKRKLKDQLFNLHDSIFEIMKHI